MTRPLRTLVFAAAAFVILSAGECDISSLGDILDEPGSIAVTNVGQEPAVVAISADDVKSYPTLAGGATASAETNVGGRYSVSVVMTPENTQRYRDELATMRRTVEQLIDGSISAADKTQLFIKLAGIKAAISALEVTNAASCSGVINLDRDNAAQVSATVRWETQGAGGFWDLSCGSN